MKHLLLTTIAAVLLVGCGPSQPPEPPTVKIPDISIWDAAADGNTEAVKQHLAAGTDVNEKDEGGKTPLDRASEAAPLNRAMTTEAANLLRKHGGKTGAELKAEGK
jgi:ankyrin repeat protein